jgi:hypothetical protein
MLAMTHMLYHHDCYDMLEALFAQGRDCNDSWNGGYTLWLSVGLLKRKWEQCGNLLQYIIDYWQALHAWRDLYFVMSIMLFLYVDWSGPQYSYL